MRQVLKGAPMTEDEANAILEKIRVERTLEDDLSDHPLRRAAQDALDAIESRSAAKMDAAQLALRAALR